MFEQLKDFKKAQAMQRAFAQEKHTVEREGIRITVNGNFSVEEIVLTNILEQKDASLLTNLINQAFQEMKQKLAKHILG